MKCIAMLGYCTRATWPRKVYGWDFSTGTTAMAQSVCDGASKTPGYAIKVREFAKFAKYTGNAECN